MERKKICGTFSIIMVSFRFTGVNYNEVRHVTNGRRSVMPDYYFIRKLFDLEKEGCECLNNRNLTIKLNYYT